MGWVNERRPSEVLDATPDEDGVVVVLPISVSDMTKVLVTTAGRKTPLTMVEV